MAKIVKKFGGTSLKNRERMTLAVNEVIESLKNGNEVIVVVSAMGAEGDPYATNTLIDLLKDVSPEVDARKQDLMMSCGETISASLFAHYLDCEGYSAIPMTAYKAGIFTNDTFGDANIIDIDPVRINHHLSRSEPVVLAGFQGRTVQGEITTLGRGGSDTTALAIAGELAADYVELFTDVPGVAVADPEIVESPKYFSSLSTEALLKLSDNGPEVVHKPAITKARESRIPIRIKCTWNEENETLVDDSLSPDLPVGITSKSGLTVYEGPSAAINRDLRLNRQAKNVFHLGAKKSLALVPREVVEMPQNGYKKTDEVSTITVVGTDPNFLREARNEVVNSLDPERYLERIVTDYGVKLLANQKDRQPLIQEIYELFYQPQKKLGTLRD